MELASSDAYDVEMLCGSAINLICNDGKLKQAEGVADLESHEVELLQ